MQQPLNTSLTLHLSKEKDSKTYMKAKFLALLVLLLALCANIVNAQTTPTTQFVSNIINANGASSNASGTVSGIHFGRNYYTNNPGTTSAVKFDGSVIGTFNRTSPPVDTLRLNANSVVDASNTGGQNVREVQFLYRVLRQDQLNQPINQGFIPISLNYVSGDVTGKSIWGIANNTLDLLQSASTPGRYVVQVYFQVSVSDPNNTTSPSSVYSDNNNGNFYTAAFDVLIDGQSVITTSWTGTDNPFTRGDWFNPINWTDYKGDHYIPTPSTDVEIPVLDDSRNYPIIYGAGIAYVHNLVIDGDPDPSGTAGARLQLDGSNLRVFGLFQDLNNGSQGFTQSGGGVLTLAGKDQFFDAGPTLQKIEITGGGTKRFTQGMDITSTFTFTRNPDGTAAGIVVLPIARGTTNTFNLKVNASIVGETEDAYIQGAITTTRTVVQGNPNNFGNIGIELTATSNSSTNVTVTRTHSVYKGPNNNVSVRRGFVFSTADNPISTYNLKFAYLNTTPFTTMLNNIKPENLVFFQSKSGGAPFTALGRDGNVDQVNKTVTVSNVTADLISTFTLGDQTRPLPVTLVSFTATGTAQGATLKWITASEINNKGFGVERQVAGATEWESVGYVTGTNAANGSSYSFLDKNLPSEATQVYYRLRQEDKTGELSYSPVAVISRAAAGADLTLSPVPLDSSPLLVSFAEAGQAGAVIDVINMQGQRVGHFASEGSADGVRLPLSHLAPGVYIVNVQVPGQATRHARFVKQ